jgi:hypothetical protein
MDWRKLLFGLYSEWICFCSHSSNCLSDFDTTPIPDFLQFQV